MARSEPSTVLNRAGKLLARAGSLALSIMSIFQSSHLPQIRGTLKKRSSISGALKSIDMIWDDMGICKLLQSLASVQDDGVPVQAVEQKQVAQQQAERARYLVLKARPSWTALSAPGFLNGFSEDLWAGSGGEEANDHPRRGRERAETLRCFMRSMQSSASASMALWMFGRFDLCFSLIYASVYVVGMGSVAEVC